MKEKFTRFLSKGYYLFLAGIIFVTFSTSAQTLLYSGFEDAVIPDPPPGWVVSNTGTVKWESLKAPIGGGNQFEGRYCMFLQNGGNGSTADAWLISTPVSFEAGKKYSISFYFKNQSFTINKFQVTLGNEALPDAQTEIIYEKAYKNNFYAKAQINYTAKESGTKYIGIHAITPKTYTYMYIDDFKVSAVSCFEPLSPTIIQEKTTSVVAKWTAPVDGTQFEYGISDTISQPKKTMLTTENFASLTPLKPATHYYFYVRTVCAPGENSSWAVQDFSTSYDTAGIEILNCRRPFSNNFRANTGLYIQDYCGEVFFGKEFFHKFIPTETGMYNLNIYSVNTGQFMSFLYKDAALGAGANDWTCIGSANDFGGKYTFGPLIAGKEYLIMEKARAAPGLPSSYSYGIDCYAPPPPNDNCDSATQITVTSFTENCKPKKLTTLGGSATLLKESFSSCGYGVGDDDIWVKFTAESKMELFRFNGMKYFNTGDINANPGMYFNIYSNPCDLKSLVDCGYVPVNPGETKDIVSYKLQRGKTYYVRLFTADNFSFATFGFCIMNVAVTNGIANSCFEGLPYPVDQYTDRDNRRSWVPQLDNSNSTYKLISAVFPKGNTLNYTTGSVFINDGALRKDAANKYYLDRNFYITADDQPSTSVGVRLVFSNIELNRLIAQSGSGVTSIRDLRVTQNLDKCSSKFTKPSTSFIIPYRSGVYNATHSFIEFEANSLSSFYIHGGNTPLTGTSVIANSNTEAVQKSANSVCSVFPNPFIDKFTVSLNEQSVAKYTLSLSNMNGQVISVYERIAALGSNQFVIETANLLPGIYMLKIEKPGSIQFKKIIKE